MKYRVGDTGFLERHVKTVGKGEVWESMPCYKHPAIRTDQHDKDGDYTGFTETIPCHCGLWCPLFQHFPTEESGADELIRLHCGGEVRVIVGGKG